MNLLTGGVNVEVAGTSSPGNTGILTSTTGPATEADIVKYGP